MEIICLDSVNSTNSWVAAHEQDLPSPCFVRAATQYAGRGQRGNSWEATPGLNVTGSLLYRPVDFPASKQFLISEAVALGVVNMLACYAINAQVKWPNDIYVGNDKICGILIENAVTGKYITRTIAGIGINVNQTKFLSDAPNPVSMKILDKHDFNLEAVTWRLTEFLQKNLELISDYPDAIHNEYMRSLWRNDGIFHSFHDKKRDKKFSARIHSVALDGILSLADKSGELHSFAFKEVEFLR